MSGASSQQRNRIPRKIAQLLRSKQGVGLDLGCGPNKQDDFIGIDSRPLPQVDIVWDLEQFPWPLPDNCAHAVVMSHFWEHVHPRNTLRFMEELHRVCRNGARVFISGPYANGFRYVQDPTHCNPSNEATWCYWEPHHVLWNVYQSPAYFHGSDTFQLIPAGNDKDFNIVLRACKPADGKCPHKIG